MKNVRVLSESSFKVSCIFLLISALSYSYLLTTSFKLAFSFVRSCIYAIKGSTYDSRSLVLMFATLLSASAVSATNFSPLCYCCMDL